MTDKRTRTLEEKKERLIRHFISSKTLKTEKVIRAFKEVPRELFLPNSLRDNAYNDTPLPIGNGQTISAPHMCVIMAEILDLEIGMKVLEIGTGSGYHAALIAEIVAPSDEKTSGHVFSIERVKKLSEFARKNIEQAKFSDRVTVIHGDGTLGYPEQAPYDRILVTAAGPKIPEPLIDQLKNGGKLVIPIGGVYFFQTLILLTKDLEGKITKEKRGGVSFVPLIGEHGH
ncbi:protein-L-isoaspartate(D-aspartate) O-methyltransferase [Candidatus Borrarchaeum sp.]|uniref:protein-L-isoaspartate(D-aspartate) O-methyltransferase n=1 Tax=Candidatus Borrarchaeum sp. TaxID=2846742 RepID=UPI00257D6ACC|nr:protein-L-isoaspartate(D-aspartate) O-methyltransferase [Candidatus Borrarchaeum sp.]